ncbi:MAG: excisionase family DNA binding protein [Phycisphaerales bacterium]|jgi:excisionase family DNA binding protein
MKNESKQLLNREEAAQWFGLSVRTLDKLTKEGGVPSFKIGRQVRYSLQALEKWVEEAQKNKGESNV